MREIISFFVGQGGVQSGMAIWELFCAEHGLNHEGKHIDDFEDINDGIYTFFQKTSIGSYVPRSLFVDLEPTVVDEIRSGTYQQLFHPDRLISGPEDASNNFSRGFFTVGKLLLGSITNQIRHLVEQADLVTGMMLLRSLGGGTGAGLTSAMFEILSDHPKTAKVEVPIYPSPTLSTSMVEPYNCLLGEHFCMEDIDVGLLLDNEAMFDMCSRFLNVQYPSYHTINRLIAQIASSITASIRFENVLNCDLSVLQTNLVPYPRIHFPLCNFAPILSHDRAVHQSLSVQELTRMVFDRENQMMKIDHFYGRFMSCALFYRGNICPHHVYSALSEIKRDKSIEFVDWCPTGFKVGINTMQPMMIPNHLFADTKKNVAMLTNTSAIGQAWQRLAHRFYLLYSKRSFVHWFVGEGMEECEFTEALYNISALVKDYEEAAEGSQGQGEDIPEVIPPSTLPTLEKSASNTQGNNTQRASMEISIQNGQNLDQKCAQASNNSSSYDSNNLNSRSRSFFGIEAINEFEALKENKNSKRPIIHYNNVKSYNVEEMKPFKCVMIEEIMNSLTYPIMHNFKQYSTDDISEIDNNLEGINNNNKLCKLTYHTNEAYNDITKQSPSIMSVTSEYIDETYKLKIDTKNRFSNLDDLNNEPRPTSTNIYSVKQYSVTPNSFGSSECYNNYPIERLQDISSKASFYTEDSGAKINSTSSYVSERLVKASEYLQSNSNHALIHFASLNYENSSLNSNVETREIKTCKHKQNHKYDYKNNYKKINIDYNEKLTNILYGNHNYFKDNKIKSSSESSLLKLNSMHASKLLKSRKKVYNRSVGHFYNNNDNEVNSQKHFKLKESKCRLFNSII